MNVLRFARYITVSLVVLLASEFNEAVAQQNTGASDAYTLGSGDELRVTVFEEPDLSGKFEIDGTGSISMPLIGEVKVQGLSLRSAERSIESLYLGGYLKKPRVNVEVTNYRPFYILGEVKEPGSYSYVNGMSVLNAIALAGGFTYRARKENFFLIRATDPDRSEVPVGPDTIILPGDIVKVRERFF